MFSTNATKSTAHHLQVKATVRPLLEAWDQAGIKVLLFKGFYLADCVYANPADRTYGDVDVLIAPEQTGHALSLAQELGWTELWRRQGSLYRFNHEAANLRKGATFLEPHRYILDTLAPWDALQRRFTRAAWAAAQPLMWEGLKLYTLTPADAVLFGIVLARSWSAGDNWQLKESDYRDVEELVTYGNLTEEALRARAKALHCGRTLDLFLERCNPWLERFESAPPSWLERQRWQLRVAPERKHLGLERLLMSLSRVPGTLADMLRYWSPLKPISTEDHLQNALDFPQQLLAPRPPQKLKERIVRGVKWCIALQHLGRRDPCLARSVALFNALAGAGYAVRLYTGKDVQGKLHAGVTIDAMTLRDLEDVQTCALVSEVHLYEAYPAPPEPATLTPLGEAMPTSAVLNDQARLHAAPDQVSAEAEGETVILNPRTGQYFSLDEVGAQVWQRLQTPARFAELKKDLLTLYDVPEEILEADLRALLSELVEARLVTVEHDPA